jgi:hypothetical protein
MNQSPQDEAALVVETRPPAPNFEQRLNRLKRCGQLAGLVLFLVIPILQICNFPHQEFNLPQIIASIFVGVLFLAYLLAACSTQLFSIRWGTVLLILIYCTGFFLLR